jgi:hypothetical protein
MGGLWFTATAIDVACPPLHGLLPAYTKQVGSSAAEKAASIAGVLFVATSALCISELLLGAHVVLEFDDDSCCVSGMGLSAATIVACVWHCIAHEPQVTFINKLMTKKRSQRGHITGITAPPT